MGSINGFIDDIYQTLTEELKPILLKHFKKTEEEQTLPSSFNDASITLIPKPDKDTKKTADQYPL